MLNRHKCYHYYSRNQQQQSQYVLVGMKFITKYKWGFIDWKCNELNTTNKGQRLHVSINSWWYRSLNNNSILVFNICSMYKVFNICKVQYIYISLKFEITILPYIPRWKLQDFPNFCANMNLNSSQRTYFMYLEPVP